MQSGDMRLTVLSAAVHFELQQAADVYQRMPVAFTAEP